MLDLRTLKIVVTGGSGFLGRHLIAALKARGCEQVVGLSRKDGSLLDGSETERLLSGADVVFHLAALCGGIGANRERPADFIAMNLQMGLNVIRNSFSCNVKKLVMVGTLCAYPKNITGEIEPGDLWNGYPEETNAPYGIAKRTLVEVGKSYRAQYGLNVINVMPTNLYGPHADSNPETSHVIPALIRRFTEARDSGAESVTCWGTGGPSRDFLYAADAVEAIIRAAELIDDSDPICLGSGQGITMAKLAKLIAAEVGFTGDILWDSTKPDGQPNRVVGTRTQIERLGFAPAVSLVDGIRLTIESLKPAATPEAITPVVHAAVQLKAEPKPDVKPKVSLLKKAALAAKVEPEVKQELVVETAPEGVKNEST